MIVKMVLWIYSLTCMPSISIAFWPAKQRVCVCVCADGTFCTLVIIIINTHWETHNSTKMAKHSSNSHIIQCNVFVAEEICMYAAWVSSLRLLYCLSILCFNMMNTTRCLIHRDFFFVAKSCLFRCNAVTAILVEFFFVAVV